MQKVLGWRKGIAEYLEGFSESQIEHPGRCSCGCAKFHKWGTYKRYVVEEEGDFQIPIQRYRCVKCLRTYSYLPSFCLSRRSCSADLMMKLLETLLLNLRIGLGESRRRLAYIYRKRFVELESLWLVFLRGTGFGDFPRDEKERRATIFTALRDQYWQGGFAAEFFEATGRHFMATK